MYQLSQYLPLIGNSQQVISRYAVKNSDFCKSIDRRLSVATLILRNALGWYSHKFRNHTLSYCFTFRHSSNAVPFSFLLQSDVQFVRIAPTPFYTPLEPKPFAPLSVSSISSTSNSSGITMGKITSCVTLLPCSTLYALSEWLNMIA